MEAICEREPMTTRKCSTPAYVRRKGITKRLNNMIVDDVASGNARGLNGRTAFGPYFADIIADKAHNFAVLLRHHSVVSSGAIQLSPLSADANGIRVRTQFVPQITQLFKRYFECPAQMYMGTSNRETTSLHVDAFSGISSAMVASYGARRSERLMGQLRLEPGTYAVVVTGKYSPDVAPEQLVEAICSTFFVENEL